MEQSVVQLQERAVAWAKRDAWLQKTSFAATLIAILLFLYFAYLVRGESAKLQELQRLNVIEQEKSNSLKAEHERLQRQNAELSLATKATQELHKVQAHVTYYRSSEKDMIEGALKALGFQVSQDAVKALPTGANAIAYGSKVDRGEVRLVASTLVSAGFHLVAIRPAARRTDPELIQVYSTSHPDAQAPYDLDSVRRWQPGM